MVLRTSRALGKVKMHNKNTLPTGGKLHLN